MKNVLLAATAVALIAPVGATAQTPVPALQTGAAAPAPAASGQAVPAAQMQAPPPAAGPVYPNHAPPPAPVVLGPNPRLTPRDRAGVAIAEAWSEGREAHPATGAEGAAIFAFGETLPSVVCAPLFVCDVMLQPGEIINDINVGDSVRWRISPAQSGVGANATTHVLLKPTDAGLTTNLVITTDRRTYVLRLVSHRTEWMPRVAFSYPEDVRREWEDFLANQRAAQAAAAAREAAVRSATVLQSGQRVPDLDFGFEIRGDRPDWRPLRVYADGRQTFIEFPASMTNDAAPALVAIGPGGGTEIINYRAEGNRYIVDQVVSRIALISGVGRHQQRVDVVREGER